MFLPGLLYTKSPGVSTKKKTRRSGFLLFWVTRYNYLGDHAARAKISSLDAFAFKGFASTAGNPLPYGFCFAELSTLLLFALSKPWQAHYKTHYLVLTFGVGLSPATVVMCFMVDLAGVEPASRTLFSLLHTAITTIYRQVFLAIQCCISCTRHASPRGSVNHIRLPLGVYMVRPSLSTPINPINISSP